VSTSVFKTVDLFCTGEWNVTLWAFAYMTDNLTQKIKITIFWDITSFTSIYRCQYFRETFCLYVAGR